MTPRLALVAAMTMVVALSGAAPSESLVHAVLERSVPAAGDTLDTQPPELALTFSGPVEVAGASIRLLGPGAADWTLDTRRPDDDDRTLRATMPHLEPGGYRVVWRVVSADGHPVQDELTFFVAGLPGASLSAPPPSPGPPTGGDAGQATVTSGPSALLVATRGGTDLALLAVAGLLLFVALAPAAPSASTTLVASALSIAAPLFASTHAWLWTAEALAPGADAGARLDALTALTTGRALGGEALLAWLVAWALLLARRPGLGAAFGLAAIAVEGLGGHAASYTPMLSIPASVVHQLAVAIWMGGLLYLVTERGAPDFVLGARRVSAAALVAVVAVAVTGLVQTWLLLGSPSALVTSTFGLLVLAKVAGLGCLVAFGAHHRFRLLPAVESADGPTRLARSVRAELAVAALVVLLAAVLSHTPPNP